MIDNIVGLVSVIPNMLYPVPAVMVSCRREGEKPNIITVAWAGTICSDPAMVSISVRKERYSHDIIKDSGEFVVTSRDQLDPAALRCLAGGIQQALAESERFPMRANILAYESHGEGYNWGAMFTTAKAATNHALGLDHLLPLVLHAPER